ncbi:hypothetical protein [Alteromonas halophila]|uniref:Uncharacterized protein n=1 Tax=Alteromonas halophila TaxID=516698 RepID=A0A918MXM5_9ALTE|nr:hypothetical protein [Alteromonas halophila]GGW79610.1 hypothetical protein GCM10007391_10500 [Alteromonas halophila]
MKDESLPLNIRIVLGLAGLPSLLLGVMLVITVVQSGLSDIGAFEVLYAVAGVVAMYIAITGRRLF